MRVGKVYFFYSKLFYERRDVMKNLRTIIVGVRLTPEEKKQLEEICEKYGVNLSTMIRDLIDKEYDKIRSK